MLNKKAIIGMALAGTLTTSLFIGCGAKADEKSNVDKDGVKTFTAFFASAGKEISKDNRVKQAIADKFGFKIEETWLTGQTAKERIGVMVAGGEYPDFIDGGDGTSSLLDAGALIPIDEYWDDYPNIKNYLTDLQWNQLRQEDGHIYYIPQFGIVQGKDMRTTHNGEAFWIQKAVLKWANWPTIKTLDEYFDLIERYKEANPTINGQPTIGYEILDYDTKYFCLENPPQFLAGYPNDGACIVHGDTLTAENYNTIPEAKQFFNKLNEEYNKGIIDPESFTNNYDQYIAKLSTGTVLGMCDQYWQFQNAETSLIQQKMFDRTYVPLALTIDPNVTSQYRRPNELNTSAGLGITTSCKDIEGAMKVINDLLSEEATILRSWGEKDKDYFVDENGLFYRNDEQRANAKDDSWVLKNMCSYSWFPAHTGMLQDGINAVSPGEQPSEYYLTLEDIDKEILEAYGYEKLIDFLPEPNENEAWYPMWTYANTLTADTPAGIAKQKMDDIKKQWLPQVVMASTDDFEKIWDEYQTTLKSEADLEAYEDAFTKEVRRRVELFSPEDN